MTNVTRERDGWQLVERPVDGAVRRVLLLPGLMGCDVVFTQLLAEPALAAAGVHAIAGNPPGFKGLPVARDFDFSIESYAALVEEIAAAEHFDVLVGHSYFANVLIEVAARGAYAGKLVLISPSLVAVRRGQGPARPGSLQPQPPAAGADLVAHLPDDEVRLQALLPATPSCSPTSPPAAS